MGNKKFTSAGFKNRELIYEHVETQLIMTMIIRDENCRVNDSPIGIYLFFYLWIHVKRLRQIEIFAEYVFKLKDLMKVRGDIKENFENLADFKQ